MTETKITENEIETQEEWSEIGTTGKPAFANGWLNYESGFEKLSYMKDSLGFVHLKGFIKSGTITYGTTICTLPVGYRPIQSTYFPCVSAAGFGSLIIGNDGLLTTHIANATWTSLGHLVYKAA